MSSYFNFTTSLHLIEQETNSAGVYDNTMACESPRMTAPFSSICGTMTWAVENRTCSPVAYTEEVCKKTLLEWKNCIVGQNSSTIILISAVESQLHMEQTIQILEVISQLNKCSGEHANTSGTFVTCKEYFSLYIYNSMY